MACARVRCNAGGMGVPFEGHTVPALRARALSAHASAHAVPCVCRAWRGGGERTEGRVVLVGGRDALPHESCGTLGAKRNVATRCTVTPSLPTHTTNTKHRVFTPSDVGIWEVNRISRTGSGPKGLFSSFFGGGASSSAPSGPAKDGAK